MTKQEWLELKIGDKLDCLTSQYAKNLVVSEISQNERSLQAWKNRGIDAAQLIRLDGQNGYHTWAGSPEHWVKVIEEL